MKKKESLVGYEKPEITICGVQTESILTTASGQHTPIGPGGSYGDAKQGWFDDEEEETLED